METWWRCAGPGTEVEISKSCWDGIRDERREVIKYAGVPRCATRIPALAAATEAGPIPAWSHSCLPRASRDTDTLSSSSNTKARLPPFPHAQIVLIPQAQPWREAPWSSDRGDWLLISI